MTLNAQRVVAVLCGLFLIAAVALKVVGSDGGSVSVLPMFSSEVQLAGLQVEAMVGIWLLSGLARQAAAFTGVALFAVLGAVSL